MFEVLIALVVISIGILGMVALQGRTIQYSNESSQRNTAAMLANDLIEMIRSNRLEAIGNNGKTKDTSSYYKLAGDEFPNTNYASCQSSSGCTSAELASNQLTMWAKQVKNSLPIGNSDELLKEQFIICPTRLPTNSSPCSAGGSSIFIQISWLGKDTCPSGQDNCQSLDNTRKEFYRISFQP